MMKLIKYLPLIFYFALLSACIPIKSTPVVFTPTQTSNVKPAKDVILPTLSIQDNTFSLQNMNKILPDDIIREVGYFGGLGGGGSVCSFDVYRQPTIPMTVWETEVLEPFRFEICGILVGENITISVEFPDNSLRQYDVIGAELENSTLGMATFTFIPSYLDPRGDYRFVFSGKGWSIEHTVSVHEPSAPRFYLVSNSTLVLLHFQPYEDVRLLAYAPGANDVKFIGWNKYKVDGNGDLLIKTEISAMYTVVGEKSGELFHLESDHPSEWYWVAGATFCKGALPSIGINPSINAVIMVDDLPVYVNGEPSNKLAKGTLVRFTWNPSCENNAWWWPIETLDGQKLTGFVQERDVHQIYLSQNPTEMASYTPPCQGTLPTRLKVGMNAQVTTSGMAPQLSLRAQPSMSAEKVHVIAAGRKMLILEGPVCADGSYWWRIRSEQGFEGWAREGDNEDYWIDPLP